MSRKMSAISIFPGCVAIAVPSASGVEKRTTSSEPTAVPRLQPPPAFAARRCMTSSAASSTPLSKAYAKVEHSADDGAGRPYTLKVLQRFRSSVTPPFAGRDCALIASDAALSARIDRSGTTR